jgi:Flp pilus assembly pilin Flp
MWGAHISPSWNRRSPLPRQLGWAQVVLWVQFALSVLYVVTVLSVVTYYSGEIVGILLYDSLPSVAGIYLARRLWRGGVWTSRALIAVQAWTVWLSFGTLLHGDLRGITQAAMPVAVIVLLRRARSREWFESAPQDREEPRAFSLRRMIRWRRDEGQTAVEYAGLIAVVAAIIVALSVGGLGGRIADGIQSAVCSVTGTACPAPKGDGTETGAAGDNDDAQHGGPNADADADADGGNGPAPDGGANADGGAGTNGEAAAEGDAGTQTGSGGREDTGAGGATGSNDSGGGPAWSTRIITYEGAGTDDTVPLAPGPFDERSLWDDVHDQERHDRTFMDHVRGFFVAPTKSFLASTMDVVSDPLGSVKDTWNGLKGYTTDWWGDKADELGEEWDKGNHVSSVWGWINSPEDFVSDLAIDTFVDKENWEKGNYGASIGNTVVGVIGIFSPKTITKFTKFDKLAEVGESLDKAADAAEKARKAARAGDFDGAKKAADEAQQHADEAKKKAEKNGSCTIAIGRVPYGGGGGLRGVPGTGTGVLAAQQGDRIVVAAGGEECTGDDAEDVRRAQQEALDARADLLREQIKAQKRLPKNERVNNLQENQLENLLRRAKDDVDPNSKEISKKAAADAIADVSELMGQKNIDPLSRGKLGSKVLNSPDKDKLAENLAEANTTKRVAQNEAADGSTVYSSVGDETRQTKLPDGLGGEIDVSGIPDADVAYRGKDGKVHVAEVKHRGNATTQASLPAQAQRLGDWQKAAPGRVARYEIATTKDWQKIFDKFQYKKQSKAQKAANEPKVRPEGTPASEMARHGVGARIAGQDMSPAQLKAMDDAWNAKSDTEKYEAIHSGKMKDPKTAMQYLGVS